MCCCEDSRRRWPLSRSKHLSEIGWNWYNPGHGIITPAWDRHETPSVFMLPISLGLGVRSSCFFDSFTVFFFPQHRLIYLVSLLDLDRLPPETELSFVRTLKKTHNRSTLMRPPVSRNMRMHANACTRPHTHTRHRTSYTALAISISPR